MDNIKINRKTKVIIAIVIILVAFIIFGIGVGKRLHTKHQQEKTISSMEESVTQILEKNSEMEDALTEENSESRNEQAARENGYVYPEERIYYDNDAE